MVIFILITVLPLDRSVGLQKIIQVGRGEGDSKGDTPPTWDFQENKTFMGVSTQK